MKGVHLRTGTHMTLILKGHDLTLQDYLSCVRAPSGQIAIDSEAKKRVRRSRETVEHIQKQNRVAYGINTGFGRLADVTIPAEDINALQENLILSHAVGVGDFFNPEEVRAIYLLRIQGLLQGHSGVREELVETLLSG